MPQADGGHDTDTRDTDTRRSDTSDPDADAATDVNDGGADGAELGELCKETTECARPANICLILPGQPGGYCSIEGCETGAASSCPEPERFSCQDISSLAPGQAPICLMTCKLDGDGSDCPPGYTCSDLSIVLGGLPPICFPGAS